MTNNDFTIQLANEDDLDQIVDMTDQWAKWFQENNIFQWGTITYADGTPKTYAERYPKEYYIEQIKRGNSVFVAKSNDGTIYSSLTLSSSDSMWPQDAQDNSYFIHRLVTNLNSKNSLATLELLKAAALKAIYDGKEFIRLDCSTDNKVLCNIYENKYGFALVETGSLADGYNYSKYEISPIQLIERITEIETLAKQNPQPKSPSGKKS